TPTPTPTVEEDEGVIEVKSRLIIVPVSVLDSNGQAVTGLTAKDFRVSEENKIQEIAEVSTAEKVPLEIVVLFDISASTDALFKFEQETAAEFLKTVMRPEDRATISTVGSAPRLVQSRETAEKSAEAIKSILPTKEFTAFYDSVAAAAEHLQKNTPQGRRKVIIVISDGEDTNSVRISKAIQDGYRKLGSKIDTMDRKTLYQLTVANRDKASLSERERVLQGLQNADTVFYSINP
ncbi:MAG TPA: VWA domain-containing protein, partial [Pyrinomonadaceae bacterium]|nr:VWA domain-containing protein [Pyrinomonadaceae bacterium]